MFEIEARLRVAPFIAPFVFPCRAKKRQDLEEV